MRVLLLHPDDSPRRGPWTRQRWDLVIDLGASSLFSEHSWMQQYGCPVWRAQSFRRGIADVKEVRKIFSAGRHRMVDEEGIDWWDFMSLLVAPEALTALALSRIAAEISPAAELWATRPSWPANLLGVLLQRPLRSFGQNPVARATAFAAHYAGLAQRFSASQIKEIFFDKYDPGYRWRSRVASKPGKCAGPVVLVPSAYGNVSSTAAAYARLLPEQSFLLVATRRSAKRFVPPPNVRVRDLAVYARGETPTDEIAFLAERWKQIAEDLDSVPELRVLMQVGVMDPFPAWLHDGLCTRDAWRTAIEREPVCGLLCGDDSNLYTRLPVALAARRKIPTVDFHHGALDGRYLLKDLPCDVYLAKSEMERDYLLRICNLPEERVVLGSPLPSHTGARMHNTAERNSAIFFSEPFESAGIRTEEIYREILPAVVQVARKHGRRLILKLHPFESLSQRRRILRDVLTPEDRTQVTVVDGPLTDDLMAQAWFGITVESSTVVECQQRGIACFLCGWLKFSPYEYVQQFARFGIGKILQSAEQILEIPTLLEKSQNREELPPTESTPADPAMLQQWLTDGLRYPSGVRSAS